MEVWILRSSKELKKKKKKEGVNEGSIDKMYEETRCFSLCP